ncbi:MAG: SecDF P1 head subdomain-containing protein [Ignavibacteriales bacterium]
MKKLSIMAVLLTALVITFSGCQATTIGKTDTTKQGEIKREKTDSKDNSTYRSIIYESDNAGEDKLSICKEVIRKRLQALGMLDAKVIFDNKNKKLVVENIKKDNIQDVAKQLSTPAKVQFKDADGNVIIEGNDIVDASSEYISGGRGGWVIVLKFSEAATIKFADATERISKMRGQNKNYISIYLDDKKLSSPMVNDKIDGGSAIIEGSEYTAESTRNDAALIKSGALPVSLKVKEIK